MIAMEEKEIEALISLIDDPDETVYEQVKSRIVAIGQPLIPKLENCWERNAFGVIFQNRIEDIIHKIQFDALYEQLHNWYLEGGKDLLSGALLVARYQYPDLDEEDVRDRISRIRQDIWLELNDNLTALEKTKVLNQVIFGMHGFRGNKQNYHAPQNSYLNNVVESKRGNPLSLSILYLVLAESLDLPIFGINLPNHFVLGYQDQFNIMKLIEQKQGKKTEDVLGSDILFYINPFVKGGILHKTEIDTFIKHLELAPDPAYYQPCSHIDIVKRLVHNLVFAYERLGYPDKVKELEFLNTAFKD